MAQHQVCTRINRRVGNFYLVVQYLLIQPPVVASDDDVCLAAQRRLLGSILKAKGLRTD